MGKTKTKFIDDSLPKEEPKKKAKDSLVEKLRGELGIESVDQIKSDKPETTDALISSDLSEKVGPRAKELVAEQKSRSKKYQEKVKDLDKNKSYSLDEAIELAKNASYTKFDGSLEAHINTIQTGLRGLVSMPYTAGKKLRILTFPPALPKTSTLIKELEEQDVIIGDEQTIEEILKGKINFDLLVVTPEWMPKLARAAKILGPRGLMPNPKNGTITTDIKKAIKGFQAGKTEYKTESKAPIIHLSLGKVSQPTQELSANIKALVITLGKTRIKKITLAPTMGPSVKLDLSTI